MSWSKQQVELLIDEYKKHECLYAMKSTNYTNKHARNRALTDIQEALTAIRPKVNIEEIKAMFHGLKNTFLTEFRKHVKSLKTGTGEDEVYMPTIWYYDQMDFILDHTAVRRSTDSIGIEANKSQQSEHCAPEKYTPEIDSLISNELEFPESDNEDNQTYTYEVQDDYSLKPLSPAPSDASVQHSTETSSGTATPTRELCLKRAGATQSKSKKARCVEKGKRAEQVMEDATDALKHISAAIATNSGPSANKPKENHYDIFGRFVASTLQEMDPAAAKEMEKTITTKYLDYLYNVK